MNNRTGDIERVGDKDLRSDFGHRQHHKRVLGESSTKLTSQREGEDTNIFFLKKQTSNRLKSQRKTKTEVNCERERIYPMTFGRKKCFLRERVTKQK